MCLCNTFPLNAENVHFCMLGQLTVLHIEEECSQKQSKTCATQQHDVHRLTSRLQEGIATYLGQTD